MLRRLSLIAAVLTALQTSSPVHAAEPNVDAVRQAALRYAGLQGRADRWSARARLRHLLPKVTASAGGVDQTDDNVQFDEWLTQDASEQLLWDSARNQNENNRRMRTDFSIRATVDLGGLLFDNEELDASREARARHEARVELCEAVHAAYFARLRLIDELRAAEAGAGRRLARDIAIAEAQLDALTGGWYAAELRSEP